ncbi:MAG: hydroxyisourate hydrolase, partial [Chloroflexi bacterium]
HASLGKLGYTIPKFELDSQMFGVGTRDALLQIQTKYKLPLTGTFDDATKAALAKAVAEAATDQYSVEGRIFFAYGLPAAGITLRIYSRGFGGTGTRLAEIKTDDQGYYALPYQPGGKAANLEVRVVEAQGKEISLSATKYNAGKHEVLNLVAPASVQPLAPEYQRLTADLNKQLGKLDDLAGAQENAARQYECGGNRKGTRQSQRSEHRQPRRPAHSRGEDSL